MKILVIGLDCAAPEILLQDERLVHLRRLMDAGCYGRLESVIPPITVPAWMCMATSQDPGSLGVYGFRNRVRPLLRRARDRRIRQVDPGAGDLGPGGPRRGTLGHHRRAARPIPRARSTASRVGCFLTPDTATDEYTHPAESVKREIADLVGEYRGRRQGLPHRRQGLAPGRDLRDEPEALPGRAALRGAATTGTTSSSSRSASTGCTTASGSYHDPRARPARAGQPLPGRDPRLLPAPRRGDRPAAGAARPTTRSSWSSPTTAPGGSTAASASTNGWSGKGCWCSTSSPETVTPFGKLDVNWEPDEGLERRRLLRPRVLQREGTRAGGGDRAGATTSASATR